MVIMSLDTSYYTARSVYNNMTVKMQGHVCLFCRHVQTPNLLLCDCNEPHIGESIVAEFFSHQSDRLVIPGGCTSKLQPLDVSLKSMFHVSECMPISYHSVLVLALWQCKFKTFIVMCVLCGVGGGHTFKYHRLYY
jgi:hypothetical protein